MNLSVMLQLANKAALEAGKEILRIYGSDDFEVETKADNSPLTRADKASHNVIDGFLRQTGIPVLSEEGRHIEYAERKNWEYLWMVDPLDGTKEFVKRNGEFTVNIALIHQSKPILGVVFAPVPDWHYWGTMQEGAFRKSKGKTTSISTKSAHLHSKGLKVVASRSHLNEKTAQFLQLLDSPEIVSMGSSLKFMLVAEGSAALYPRFGPTMEWDTAAAHAIVMAAGGTVYKEPGRGQMQYNKENLLNPNFLVMG